MLLLALYLALILITFNKSDPGWSHSVAADVIRNSGGSFGARVADILLSAFGISAWWWVALCMLGVRWSFRRIEKVEARDNTVQLNRVIIIAVLIIVAILVK
jgi:S-DNA-T family DNA segregation ATPase FtsK/SpoIIIE